MRGSFLSLSLLLDDLSLLASIVLSPERLLPLLDLLLHGLVLSLSLLLCELRLSILLGLFSELPHPLLLLFLPEPRALLLCLRLELRVALVAAGLLHRAHVCVEGPSLEHGGEIGARCEASH